MTRPYGIWVHVGSDPKDSTGYSPVQQATFPENVPDDFYAVFLGKYGDSYINGSASGTEYGGGYPATWSISRSTSTSRVVADCRFSLTGVGTPASSDLVVSLTESTSDYHDDSGHVLTGAVTTHSATVANGGGYPPIAASPPPGWAVAAGVIQPHSYRVQTETTTTTANEGGSWSGTSSADTGWICLLNASNPPSVWPAISSASSASSSTHTSSEGGTLDSSTSTTTTTTVTLRWIGRDGKLYEAQAPGGSLSESVATTVSDSITRDTYGNATASSSSVSVVTTLGGTLWPVIPCVPVPAWDVAAKRWKLIPAMVPSGATVIASYP